MPANNLGHYVLLNYRELGSILWGAIADINASVDARRKSAAVRAIWSAIVVTVLGLLITVVAHLPVGVVVLVLGAAFLASI